jgi:hypothetical protein
VGGPHGWLYRAADGSEHDLNSSIDQAVAYTSDGSFLRFKRYPADTTQPVEHREIESPDGAVHEFGADSKLTKIRDQFGHWIKIDYSQANKWVITRGYNAGTSFTTFRTITINFASRPFTYPTLSEANIQIVLSSVVVPVAGDSTAATHTFHYEDAPINRDGCGDYVSKDRSQITVSLLTQIDLPGGLTYIPSHNMTAVTSCAAGTLHALTSPAGRTIECNVAAYELPTSDCDLDHPWTALFSGSTVVVFDSESMNTVMPSARACDTKVAGVVSPSPGLLLGIAGTSKVKIATTGRVKVMVDATNSPILIGDLLATNDRPGTAMRSEPIDVGGVEIHRPGTLIGKALEPLESGEGRFLSCCRFNKR